MFYTTNPTLELSIFDLLKLREQKASYLLLDVRENSERLISTFPNSLHIPMHQIPSRWQDLPRDQQIIVFCHYGTRSRIVVEFLKQQGLENVFNLSEGIDAWARDIEPEMERY